MSTEQLVATIISAVVPIILRYLDHRFGTKLADDSQPAERGSE